MKMDLALNNLQRLICHKTHQIKPSMQMLVEPLISSIANQRQSRYMGLIRHLIILALYLT